MSLYDARPFFEKALQYGVQNNIIDNQKLAAISVDAPKGMVQIARTLAPSFCAQSLKKPKIAWSIW